MCEYSKFRIESNSYLLFDSIRNWRNYSKFSNTYLTVISRATETQFVCTSPARSRCTHLSVEPSAAPPPSPPPCVFLPFPLPWVPWPCTHARCPVCACSQRRTVADWLRYNGRRQTQRMVSWALALLSVFLWIKHGDVLHLKYVLILVLPMWYCRSGSHMPHVVWSAPHMSEKPPQLSYSHA